MTIGVSPKAILPAIILVVCGTLALVAGVLGHDQAAVTVGAALIAAAGVQFPVAYQAQPGNVQPADHGPGNDELLAVALPPEQRAQLDA